MKKKSLKQYRSIADKLWFQTFLQPKCELCDRPAKQCHHFYHKSTFGHLRYDKANAVSLCLNHHFQLHHQDPKKVEYQIIQKRGQKWLKELQARANNPPRYYKISRRWYEDMIGYLKYGNK